MSTPLPLRLEWTLATPWCPPSYGLHLDGLVAWAIVQQAIQDGGVPASYDELLGELPFDVFVTDNGWVWKASLIQPIRVLGSERRYMTSKTAVEPFAQRMIEGHIEGNPLKTIDTVRGLYKNDAFWYTIEHVEKLVAYCIGDPERITPLLDHVTHLGKRTRMDHGRAQPVEGFLVRIVEDDTALNLWRQRNMPMPFKGHQPIMGRLRPPYWKGEDATMVWRPL